MSVTPEQLAREIVRTATRFVHLRETKSNADWDDPATPGNDRALVEELREMMRPGPWESGWAYCAAFAEGVVAKALFNLGRPSANFRRVMSPHCVTAAKNFRERSLLSMVPAVGSIWLARHGSSENGHAGIVTILEPGRVSMGTIEGNTSLDPSSPDKEREGDWITGRIRAFKGIGDLRTMGFVTPADILSL